MSQFPVSRSLSLLSVFVPRFCFHSLFHVILPRHWSPVLPLPSSLLFESMFTHLDPHRLLKDFSNKVRLLRTEFGKFPNGFWHFPELPVVFRKPGKLFRKSVKMFLSFFLRCFTSTCKVCTVTESGILSLFNRRGFNSPHRGWIRPHSLNMRVFLYHSLVF